MEASACFLNVAPVGLRNTGTDCGLHGWLNTLINSPCNPIIFDLTGSYRAKKHICKFLHQFCKLCCQSSVRNEQFINETAIEIAEHLRLNSMSESLPTTKIVETFLKPLRKIRTEDKDILASIWNFGIKTGRDIQLLNNKPQILSSPLTTATCTIIVVVAFASQILRLSYDQVIKIWRARESGRRVDYVKLCHETVQSSFPDIYEQYNDSFIFHIAPSQRFNDIALEQNSVSRQCALLSIQSKSDVNMDDDYSIGTFQSNLEYGLNISFLWNDSKVVVKDTLIEMIHTNIESIDANKILIIATNVTSGIKWDNNLYLSKLMALEPAIRFTAKCKHLFSIMSCSCREDDCISLDHLEFFNSESLSLSNSKTLIQYGFIDSCDGDSPPFVALPVRLDNYELRTEMVYACKHFYFIAQDHKKRDMHTLVDDDIVQNHCINRNVHESSNSANLHESCLVVMFSYHQIIGCEEIVPSNTELSKMDRPPKKRIHATRYIDTMNNDNDNNSSNSNNSSNNIGNRNSTNNNDVNSSNNNSSRNNSSHNNSSNNISDSNISSFNNSHNNSTNNNDDNNSINSNISSFNNSSQDNDVVMDVEVEVGGADSFDIVSNINKQITIAGWCASEVYYLLTQISQLFCRRINTSKDHSLFCRIFKCAINLWIYVCEWMSNLIQMKPQLPQLYITDNLIQILLYQVTFTASCYSLPESFAQARTELWNTFLASIWPQVQLSTSSQRLLQFKSNCGMIQFLQQCLNKQLFSCDFSRIIELCAFPQIRQGCSIPATDYKMSILVSILVFPHMWSDTFTNSLRCVNKVLEVGCRFVLLLFGQLDSITNEELMQIASDWCDNNPAQPASVKNHGNLFTNVAPHFTQIFIDKLSSMSDEDIKQCSDLLSSQNQIGAINEKNIQKMILFCQWSLSSANVANVTNEILIEQLLNLGNKNNDCMGLLQDLLRYDPKRLSHLDVNLGAQSFRWASKQFCRVRNDSLYQQFGNSYENGQLEFYTEIRDDLLEKEPKLLELLEPLESLNDTRSEWDRCTDTRIEAIDYAANNHEILVPFNSLLFGQYGLWIDYPQAPGWQRCLSSQTAHIKKMFKNLDAAYQKNPNKLDFSRYFCDFYMWPLLVEVCITVAYVILPVYMIVVNKNGLKLNVPESRWTNPIFHYAKKTISQQSKHPQSDVNVTGDYFIGLECFITAAYEFLDAKYGIFNRYSWISCFSLVCSYLMGFEECIRVDAGEDASNDNENNNQDSWINEFAGFQNTLSQDTVYSPETKKHLVRLLGDFSKNKKTAAMKKNLAKTKRINKSDISREEIVAIITKWGGDTRNIAHCNFFATQKYLLKPDFINEMFETHFGSSKTNISIAMTNLHSIVSAVKKRDSLSSPIEMHYSSSSNNVSSDTVMRPIAAKVQLSDAKHEQVRQLSALFGTKLRELLKDFDASIRCFRKPSQAMDLGKKFSLKGVPFMTVQECLDQMLQQIVC